MTLSTDRAGIELPAEPSRLVSLVQRARTLTTAGGGERLRSGRNAIAAFLIRVVSAGLLYVSQVLLARWMGSSEYGIYISVWTWVLVLGGLSSLGLNPASMRLVPEYRETGRLDALRGLLLQGRLMVLATGTLAAALGMLGLWLFGAALSGPYLLPAYLALVCVPIYALADMNDGVGRGQAWMDVALVPVYVLRPALLLVAMVVAHEADLPMAAATAAGAAIVATWLSAVVQILWLGLRLAPTLPKGPRVAPVSSWLATSLPLLVVSAAELVLQNADILLVALLMTPADVGIYFAAAKTMSLILFVHYAVGSALSNRFAALHARGDRDGLHRVVADSVRWTFWPSLAGGIVILALGEPILRLFGPQFVAGTPAMLVLVIGFLGRAAVGPADVVLKMLGQQRAAAAVHVAAAIFNIALCLVLIPRFGMTGAAASTATALLVVAAATWHLARTRLGLETGIWHTLRRKPA